MPIIARESGNSPIIFRHCRESFSDGTMKACRPNTPIQGWEAELSGSFSLLPHSSGGSESYGSLKWWKMSRVRL